MISNEIGLKLHDRATRGHQLTSEEQEQLQAWYNIQDQAEAAMVTLPKLELPDLHVLQDQIDQALTQLSLSSQQLKSITQENNILRQQNGELMQQLNIQRSA